MMGSTRRFETTHWVEYTLLLALITVVAIAAVTFLGSPVEKNNNPEHCKCVCND